MTKQLGATGQFPGGKLNRHDEGALRFAVGSRGGKVVLDFGTPVNWMAMEPQDAERLAAALLCHAKKAVS